MADPVLQWAGQATAASKAVGGVVPTSVLLGLVKIESGGNRWAVSSAGAKWLTQFEPAAAAEYGVTGENTQSQLTGAARYLVALGFAHDPAGALAQYNAGSAPGFLQRAGSYPANVLAAAKAYSGTFGKVPAAGSSSASTSSSSAIDTPQQHSDALRALLTVVFVLGGAGLVYIGVNAGSGGALNRAAHSATRVGEVAAA